MPGRDTLRRRKRSIKIAEYALLVLAVFVFLFAVAIVADPYWWPMQQLGALGAVADVLDYVARNAIYPLIVVMLMLTYATIPFRRDWKAPARWFPFVLAGLVVLWLNELMLRISLELFPFPVFQALADSMYDSAVVMQSRLDPILIPGTILGLGLLYVGVIRLFFERRLGMFRVIFFGVAVSSPALVIGVSIAGEFSRQFYWTIYEEFMLVVAGTLALASFAIVLLARVASRLPVDLTGDTCLRCGYSMAGIPGGVCPECGTDVRAELERIEDGDAASRGANPGD